MDKIELKPIRRQVSCIGLGCARLDGRVGLKQSTRLIEAALDLGINYFDVAAAYGTAEEALGQVLDGSPDVIITTKVGPPRQTGYNSRHAWLRTRTKLVLDRMRTLKVLLRDTLAATRNRPARPRYDFSKQAIKQSLVTSLKKLRRDRIDVLLAHEPHRDDLNPQTQADFQALVDSGLISAFGVGIGAPEGCWAPFGSIWQSGWPGLAVADYSDDLTYIFHSVLRLAKKDRWGRTTTPATELVRAARQARPNSVILVSASTPERLREIVDAAGSVN